jgi:Lrp/AsnC family leucine-responsive transcriptional regulator
MDDLDRKIIASLLEDARAPYAQIAQRLGVATTTVHQRARRLREQGVITGSRVIVDWEKIGLPVTALVSVEQIGSESLKELANRLQEIRYLQACYSVTGEFDLMVVVRAASSDHLGEILEEIRSVAAGRSRTVVVLATHFDNRAAPIEH